MLKETDLFLGESTVGKSTYGFTWALESNKEKVKKKLELIFEQKSTPNTKDFNTIHKISR